MLEEILGYVGIANWEECCWSDEGLSFKKMYPGHQYTSKSKKWLPRVRVTEESMMLTIKRAQHKFQKAPKYLRKKYTASQLETMSETGAAVWHLGKELLLTVAIPAAVLQTAWYDAWQNGSDHIDLEVQSAILEKSDTFDITKIPTFKTLIDEHIFAAPVQATNTAQIESIEVDNFNLLLKKVDYDVSVYETWEKKCSSVYAAHEHVRREHRLSERQKCADAADIFLASCTKLLVWDSRAENVIKDLIGFRRDNIAVHFGNSANIGCIAFLNWASMSLIPATVQDKQMMVSSWLLHDCLDSVCPVLSPVFSYGKGKLYLEETKMMNMLSNGHHNVDTQFSVLFKDQSDARDTRPMMYPGRLLFPAALNDLSKSPWYACDLRRLRRTAEISQLSSSSMKEIEDLAADALPHSTNERDNHVHGPAKFAQLGTDAWDAMTASLMDGANLKDMSAVWILDLFPNVGESLRSFCVQRANYSTSLFWTGICQSQTECDWILHDCKEFLVEKFEAGALPMPKNIKLQAEVSPDFLEHVPAEPKLNVLVIDENKNLQIPIAIVKEWATNSKFGQQFSKWLDTFMLKYSIADPSSGPVTPGGGVGTPVKRKANGAAGPVGPSPAKVPKVSDLKHLVVETSSITDSLLSECSLTGKNAPMAQLRTGHHFYLVNKSAGDWSSPSLCLLAGFGRGAFKLIKNGEALDDAHIPFSLTSSSDLVVFNGQALTLGQVLNDQREKKPTAEVCYHTVSVDDVDPKSFTLERTHNVIFLPKKDEGQTVTLNSFAVNEPVTTFTSSEGMQLLWSVRWTAKGLMPVKPAVYLKGSVTIPTGRALHCTGSASA